MTDAGEAAWSVPIQVAEIPETGRRFELTADAVTREAIAKVAGVVALPRLEAAFDLAPLGRDGVRVTGAVSATVEQNCVVTLEPLISQVEQRIDLMFVPDGTALPQDLTALSATDDPPEPLQNGAVELGALAVEFLLLGIDPYPRKPHSSFEAPRMEADPATHPFAALAALKSDSGKKSR